MGKFDFAIILLVQLGFVLTKSADEKEDLHCDEVLVKIPEICYQNAPTG